MIKCCRNSIFFLPFGWIGLGVDVVVVVVVEAAVEVLIVAVVFVVVAAVGSDVIVAHWSKEGASLGPPTALHSACRVR